MVGKMLVRNQETSFSSRVIAVLLLTKTLIVTYVKLASAVAISSVI